MFYAYNSMMGIESKEKSLRTRLKNLRGGFFMPKKTSAQIRAAKRSRNFATIIYPESAAPDWKTQLEALHTPILISPLHDKDVNPDGKQKKPHRHILIMYPNPKDYDTQVKPVLKKIGAVGRETVASTRGYARYLCHLDNAEKAQYDPKDIIALGGADYAAITRLQSDVRQATMDIMRWCSTNQIYSLAELLDYAAEKQPEWFDVLSTQRCYIVTQYLKALVWEREHNYTRLADRTAEDDKQQPIATPKCKVADDKIIDVTTGEIVGIID